MLEEIINVIQDISTYGLEKLGLYYSKYRGFVHSIDDPKGLNRIRVNVPEVYGDGVPNYWAWPTTFAGKGYGLQCLPQVNDLVWVSFEKGNPRKPLWSHGYFGTSFIPQELKGNGKYWFRSPKGLTILLDDNNETVSLFKKDKELQPMVLANTLKSLVEELLDMLKDGRILTGDAGPQGFIPTDLVKIEQLRAKLDQMKSEDNKLS